VQPISPSDVSDAIKLVAAGRVDLGISQSRSLLRPAAARPGDRRGVAMVLTALNSIIARGDCGVHNIRDLQGRPSVWMEARPLTPS
jgi:hypothetical protein